MPTEESDIKQQIWKLHLQGFTNKEIAVRFGNDKTFVNYAVRDQKSKYPMEVERAAMYDFVRSLKAKGLTDRTIRRRVWDVFQMLLPVYKMKEILSMDGYRATNDPKSALGEILNTGSSRYGVIMGTLPVRVSSAVCAFRPTLKKHVIRTTRKLVKRIPPRSCKLVREKQAKRTVTLKPVEDVEALVMDLLEEFVAKSSKEGKARSKVKMIPYSGKFKPKSK